MKQRILFLTAAVVLVGASLLTVWSMLTPTRVSEADGETFARANQLYANGNYDAAANLYTQLVASGIENAELYHNLGATYTAMGKAKQADEMYARARELSPRAAFNGQVGGLPLSQNELAFAALAVAGFFALGIVLFRSRPISKFDAIV